ncbi:MAG: putative zinc metalloprotease, partial [Thermomicrobiales bacterium]|nr:putative zinc metalloprotease [Thermomicrobiales bacterium]
MILEGDSFGTPGPISPPGFLVAYSLGETDCPIASRARAGRRKSTMPRRVFHLQALVILTLLLSAASPVAATAGETVSMPVAAVEPRFQEEVVVEEEILEVEDEFSSFTMPGLAPDNLTETVLADIDAFWAGELANLGHDYYAAGTVPVTDVVQSSCGQFGPYDNPAAYCPVDEFVYYSVPLGQDIQTTVGDYAWITILAHEWGHHVQVVLGITPELTIDRELQADCFSGAYAQRALQQGFLQEGDISEA